MTPLAKLGAAAAWIYTRHLLTFAIGGLLVGFETIALMAPLMATPSPSYTVGVVTGLAVATILFSGAKVCSLIRSALSKLKERAA